MRQIERDELAWQRSRNGLQQVITQVQMLQVHHHLYCLDCLARIKLPMAKVRYLNVCRLFPRATRAITRITRRYTTTTPSHINEESFALRVTKQAGTYTEDPTVARVLAVLHAPAFPASGTPHTYLFGFDFFAEIAVKFKL